MFRVALAPLIALLLGAPLAAQPKSKLKAPAPAIKPEPIKLVPGQPMSQRALTQRPAPLVGLRGWTLETKLHRGPMYAFAFNPDEKVLATGGHDGTVRLWDALTGKLQRALVGHHYVITSLAFSPDGKVLASAGSGDGTIRLWDPADGQPLRVFPMKAGNANWVAWSPDGRTLAAAGGTSGYVWLYDIGGDRGDVTVETGNPISAIAWSPDSTSLAVASTRTPLWLVGRDTGKLTETLGEAGDAPQSVAWSADSKLVAAGSLTAVHLWDVAQRKKVATMATPAAQLAWSPDGKLIATAASYGPVSLWDAASRQPRRPAIAGTSVYSMRFRADQSLAVLSYTALAMWKPDGDKPVKSFGLAQQTPPLWTAGRPIVTGLGENSLALWSATSGKRIALLEGHTAAVSTAAWSKDGKFLATGGHDGRIIVWDPAGKRLATAENAGVVVSLSWSPDGKQLASGATDYKVTIWDAAAGKPVRVFEGHRAAVYALAWCPAGKLLAAGGYDQPVRIWNVETGKAQDLPRDQPAGQALAWSSNGKLLATGGASDSLRFWTPNGKAPPPIGERVPQPPTTLLSWAPRDEVLAVCRTGSGVYLYAVHKERERDKPLHGLANWSSAVHVGWSAKADTIAVGCQDRTVRFWDTGTAQLRAMLIAEPAGTLAITPEGHYKCDPTVEADLVVVTQTERGQELLPVSRFATKTRWKNQPSAVKLTN